MAAAKVTLTLTPAQFDLLRESLQETEEHTVIAYKTDLGIKTRYEAEPHGRTRDDMRQRIAALQLLRKELS